MTLFGILLSAAILLLGVGLLWLGIVMNSPTAPFVILMGVLVVVVGVGTAELS